MELISKLNYDICKIIEKKANIIIVFRSKNNDPNTCDTFKYYGNNENYITTYNINHIVFVKFTKKYKIYYHYHTFEENNDMLRRYINSSDYFFKESKNNKEESIISFKEFFKKIDDIYWFPMTTLFNKDPHRIIFSHLPEFIHKKDLKKICIDFLFNKNFKFKI